MKKTNTTKLALRSHSIRNLSAAQLRFAVGGCEGGTVSSDPSTCGDSDLRRVHR